MEKTYTELGFVANRDKVGFAGVELTLNDILMGKNGTRVVEQDVAGKILRDLEPPVEPIPGNNVELTIDSRLQAAARSALNRPDGCLEQAFSRDGVKYRGSDRDESKDW